MPRSTGSDSIVHISVIRAGFLVLWHVGLLADKDKARCRGETSDVVSSYSNDSHLKFKIKLLFPILCDLRRHSDVPTQAQVSESHQKFQK